jgi:hypothetical protein
MILGGFTIAEEGVIVGTFFFSLEKIENELRL